MNYKPYVKGKDSSEVPLSRVLETTLYRGMENLKVRKTYEHESWKAEDRTSSHLREAANYRRKLKTKQERVSRMAKIKELLKTEK